MIGSEDPEYQIAPEASAEAAMAGLRLRRRALGQEAGGTSPDIMSVLLGAEVEGEKLDQLEIDLFFLLLIVAGNETTRNLMSGAMTAFFEHPDQWQKLVADRSLLPSAVEEMLRFVTPVMHFRRTATRTRPRRPGDEGGRQGRLLAHLGQPRRAGPSTTPTPSTSPGTPTTTWPSAGAAPTSAWVRTWPGWRSGSCSTASSTACPTCDSTVRCSGSSRISSTAPSTSRWPSPRPPSAALRCPLTRG